MLLQSQITLKNLQGGTFLTSENVPFICLCMCAVPVGNQELHFGFFRFPTQAILPLLAGILRGEILCLYSSLFGLGYLNNKNKRA